jgi:hypothetical protein
LNMAPSGALIITVYELVKRLSKREEGGSSSSLT